MKLGYQLILGAALCWVALQTTACAVNQKQKDQDAVSKVKTAAFTSFAADFPAANQLGFNLNSGKLGATAGGSMMSQQLPEADELYEKIRTGFAKKMNWKVLTNQQMRFAPAYKDAYKSTMEGWQNKMPPGSGMNRYVVDGVMDFDSARILDKAGREKLMNDLRVDALIAVWSSTHLSGTSVMGIGSKKPQTTLHIAVYGRGSEQPIWREALQGEEIKESVGMTGYFDEKKLAKLVLQAADGAIERLGAVQ